MVLTEARVVCDGTLKIDGGALFGQLPKTIWENIVSTDRRNRITLGLNCWLLNVAGQWVLVDAGVGTNQDDKDKEYYGMVPSRMFKELKNAGLTPKDISAVVLTHLHFEHSGGCTRMDRTGSIVPTFFQSYLLRSAGLLGRSLRPK